MGGQPQTPNAPVLSRSSALRGSASVVLLLSCATVAFAQTGELQHTTRDPSRGATLPPTGAALIDQSTSPVVNPAGVRFVESAELFYLHERSVNRGEVVDGLYLADSFFDFIGLGFGMEWVRGTPGNSQNHRKTSWSLALGSRLLSLGTSFNLYSSSDANLDRITSWDLGLTLRPIRQFALAGVVKNIDHPSEGTLTFPRLYDIGAGIRPIGERLTVGLDYLFNDIGGFSSGRAQYTLQAEILRGLVLGAGLSHGFRSPNDVTFQVALTLNASNFGLTYSQGVASSNLDYLVAARISFQKYPAFSLSGGKVMLVDLEHWLNPPSNASLELLGLGDGDPYLRLVRLLDESARDPQLRGVVLKVGSLPRLGLGHAVELREAIQRLQSAGKKVIAVLLIAGDAEYLMASTADKIYAVMESELPINGFSASAVFLGDAMDKLGVRWDVARVGAYKNAPDALTRSQMSKEQEETINAYLDTDVQFFQTAVRTARKIDQKTVEDAWKEGLLTPQRAKSLGLIDEVITIADIPSRVAQWIPNATYEPTYRPQQTRDTYWGRRPQVAIVPIVGLITPGRSQRDPFGLTQSVGSDTVVKAIRRAADNDSVDAIVVRVDSGGGDGLASNLMYQAIVEARKKKPVIASMGDVAASGGYYAAMGADQIFAPLTAITGSIGVFLLKPGLSPLADKLGIHHKTIKRGDLSDFLNVWDPWTPTQKAEAQKWVDSFYDNFISEVAKSRKLSKERVDQIARGRVWSGKDAQARGLVDQLGGIFDAIEAARRKAGIPDGADVDLVIYSEPRGLFAGLAADDGFLARVFGEHSDSKGGLPEGLQALAKELGLEQAFLLEPTVKAMMPFTLKVE